MSYEFLKDVLKFDMSKISVTVFKGEEGIPCDEEAAKAEAAEAKMTVIEQTLFRKMDNDYPATPKEVIKYYNDITKCLYNEDPTDEQTTQLIKRMRELFDDELLAINSEVVQGSEIRSAQKDYEQNDRSISLATVTNSANVEYFEKNGYSCASITSNYTIRTGNNKVSYVNQYILRKDENKRWKIYGWVTKDE